MTLLEWINTHDDTDKQGGHILKQWSGKDEFGNNIDISDISPGSGKKVLWICDKNSEHKWLAKPVHRTSYLSGCPICNKARASERVRKGRTKEGINDLLTWCNNNGSFGKQLKQEFTGIDIDNNKYEINNIAYGSKIKLKWICKNNHEWYADLCSRTSSLANCPYCMGNKVISGETDLYTWCIKNNRQDIIDSFIGKDVEDNNVDIHLIKPMTHLKVKWKHIKDKEEHIWSASVRHVTLNNSGCPYCNGSKRVLSGFNDLLSWCNRNPEFGNTIIHEYTGVDIYGNKVDIDKIAAFSCTKLLWQHINSNGEMHQWYASLYNRISHKTMCPLCNNRGTSLPEQIIYRCFKQLYTNTISRGKYQGYEFDITIPELKTCIEYGSTYYHEGREERDSEKLELCKKYNVNLIIVLDDSSKKIGDVWEDNLVITHIAVNKLRTIEKIVKHLFKVLHINYNDINFKEAVQDSIDFMNE